MDSATKLTSKPSQRAAQGTRAIHPRLVVLRGLEGYQGLHLRPFQPVQGRGKIVCIIENHGGLTLQF